MNTRTVSIQIPSPCHESWDKMQSDSHGRFCGSCQKTVIDFTNKSDLEIRNLLLARAGEKVCGHFKKTQVDRPLQLTIDLTTLPRNIMPARAFAIALLLTFGTTLVSCYDHHGAKINKIEMSTASKNNYVTTTTGEPVPSETEDSISVRKAPTGLDDNENTGIKGDVIISERIMGKISFREKPIDSLVSGEIKTCNLPDSIKEGSVIRETFTMGMVAIEPPTDEQNKNDTTLSREELKTALNNLEDTPENSFTIYPNPSGGQFNMQYTLLKSSDVQVHVFNADGELIQSPVNIKSQHGGQYRIPLDLTEQPAGVYVIMLIENGKKITRQLIVTK